MLATYGVNSCLKNFRIMYSPFLLILCMQKVSLKCVYNFAVPWRREKKILRWYIEHTELRSHKKNLFYCEGG